MSKTIFLVTLLVLAMCISVSAGSVTITQYADNTCTTAQGSQTISTGQCISQGGLSAQFQCGVNGTTTQTSYMDANCNNKVGSPVVYQPNVCTGGLKFGVCSSSAWNIAPSVLIIGMVSVIATMAVKRF